MRGITEEDVGLSSSACRTPPALAIMGAITAALLRITAESAAFCMERYSAS
jgi:hypothetical protein